MQTSTDPRLCALLCFLSPELSWQPCSCLRKSFRRAGIRPDVEYRFRWWKKRSILWRYLRCKGAFHTAVLVLMSVPTKLSRSSWVLDSNTKSFLFHVSTRVVLSSGKATVPSKVSHRNPRWIGIQVGSIMFSPSYGPSTTHEYQDYHVDLKDHLAVTFGLIGKVIHEGCQDSVLATKENKNRIYHEGQYSWRTL